MNRVIEILEYLCQKYRFDFNRITLKTFKGNKNINGTCSYKRLYDGRLVIKDYDNIVIGINESILNDERKLIATLTHEFAHALQLYFLGYKACDKLRNKKPIVRFTNYNNNLLEIQAEAFTVFELGYTNNSYVGARNLDCYKSNIEEFFNQFEMYNDNE